MAEPFIFIGTHRVKAGKLDDFKDYFAKFCANIVEPNEPRLLSFQGYSDDSDEITVVQVHPDSDSMLTHLSLIREHLESAFTDYLEPESSYQIYGAPRGGIVAMVQQMSADRHVALTMKQPFVGFQRLPDF